MAESQEADQACHGTGIPVSDRVNLLVKPSALCSTSRDFYLPAGPGPGRGNSLPDSRALGQSWPIHALAPRGA